MFFSNMTPNSILPASLGAPPEVIDQDSAQEPGRDGEGRIRAVAVVRLRLTRASRAQHGNPSWPVVVDQCAVFSRLGCRACIAQPTGRVLAVTSVSPLWIRLHPSAHYVTALPAVLHFPPPVSPSCLSVCLSVCPP